MKKKRHIRWRWYELLLAEACWPGDMLHRVALIISGADAGCAAGI